MKPILVPVIVAVALIFTSCSQHLAAPILLSQTTPPARPAPKWEEPKYETVYLPEAEDGSHSQCVIIAPRYHQEEEEIAKDLRPESADPFYELRHAPVSIPVRKAATKLPISEPELEEEIRAPAAPSGTMLSKVLTLRSGGFFVAKRSHFARVVPYH